MLCPPDMMAIRLEHISVLPIGGIVLLDLRLVSLGLLHDTGRQIGTPLIRAALLRSQRVKPLTTALANARATACVMLCHYHDSL
jgi:hypothetical protein